MPISERVRDVAAAFVLVVAATALVATSPPYIVVELPISAGGSVELTGEATVAVVPITIRASDEALWPSDPAIRLADAWVFFGTGRGGVGQQAGDAPSVRLTLVPTGDAAVMDPDLENGQVYLDRLCPPDRDCELTFDLVVEWLEPEPGGGITVSWQASGRVMLEGTEELPIDATAGVAAEKPEARAITILSDQLASEEFTLSAEQPLVVRHVIIEANAAALPAPVEYPLEGRALVQLRADERVSRTLSYSERAYVASLVPDPETPAWGPTEELDRPLVQFDPFAGCVPSEPCRRGYTLRVEWISSDPTATVDVSWSLDARLLFHEGPDPADGASVTVEQDGAWAVDEDAPAITASHSGRLEVPTERGGLTVRQPLVIRLNADAVPVSEPVAGGPPAVTTITLRAGADRDLGDGERSPFLVNVDLPADDLPYSYSPHATEGEGATLTVLPLRGCEQGQPCEVEIVISAGLSAGQLGEVRDASLWVDWEVDVKLAYVAHDEVPPGARLEIGDGPDR